MKMEKMPKHPATHMKKIFAAFFLLLSPSFFLLLLLPSPARAAASLALTPAETDLQALPRDILHGSVTVKNTDTRPLALHAFVYNIDPTVGKVAFTDPSEANWTDSLANWIAIDRGLIMLNPGQSQTVDYEIDLGPVAKTGIYHAVIIFGDGLVRDDAEKTLPSMPQAAINLQVMDDAHEILEIAKFTPDRPVFLHGNPSFSVMIRNSGNRPETPTGEIRIIDSRGAEAASIPINGQNQTVSPGATAAFPASLGKSLPPGSFKAVLDLAYGPSQARIGDTVFFWYLPWYIAALLFGLLLIIGGLFALYVHARYMRWHYERLRHLGIGMNKREVSRRVLDLRKSGDNISNFQ